ncbi:MAG: hypothetical protein M3680_12240 [Myxococcota bacterium]|nr:hypothetical protein [Myxococcota bacterium]
MADDAPVTAACEQAWLRGPVLSTPRPLTTLNEPSSRQLSPFLTADGLTLSFTSAGPGTHDVYLATRAALDLPSGAPMPVASVNTPANDYELRTSPDGREAFVGSDRGGQSDIWRAERDTADGPWSPFAVVAELATSATEYNPMLAAGDRTLYFAAVDRLGGLG